jgi:hypothetical protein
MRIFIALALIVAGFRGALLGLISTRRVRRQDRWRKVRGTVVDGQVVWTRETHSPQISYKYVVDAGNVVKSGSLEYNWRGPAETIVSRYPAGADITVFVDPSDMSKAVLEPGGSNIYPFFIALSVIGLIAGLAVLAT